MKHYTALLTFAAGAAALFIVDTAQAQYYDDGRRGGPGYGWDNRRRDRDWDRRPPPPPPGWGQPAPPPGWGNRPPPRRGGGVCVTSRGACPAGPLNSGSPCRCDLPGFGTKRGVVQ
ncbi:hypothetical protein [Pseudochelatococcus sp. G4_1912]|uniref:hypothetical protein n=1 Tax=Pseudochelatococcus sp. G4_1912 TaxID=3114288 RepID=UPI0039C6DB64